MPVTWVEWVETDIVTCSGLQAQRLPAAIPTLLTHPTASTLWWGIWVMDPLKDPFLGPVSSREITRNPVTKDISSPQGRGEAGSWVSTAEPSTSHLVSSVIAHRAPMVRNCDSPPFWQGPSSPLCFIQPWTSVSHFKSLKFRGKNLVLSAKLEI